MDTKELLTAVDRIAAEPLEHERRWMAEGLRNLLGPDVETTQKPSIPATRWVGYYRDVLKRIANGYTPAASLANTALDWEIHAPECESHLTKIENCTCEPNPPGVEQETDSARPDMVGATPCDGHEWVSDARPETETCAKCGRIRGFAASGVRHGNV